MKRTAPLVLSAALLLLAACGGASAPVSASSPSPVPSGTAAPAETPESVLPLSSQPAAGVPWEGDAEALPTQPTDFLGGWEPGVFLLCRLPEEEVSLYGLCDQEGAERLLLRSGETLTVYDLPWLTPRRILPQLFSGDYDGDGERELLLLTYTDSGTGVSVWTLTVFEREEMGWSGLSLSGSQWADALEPQLSCQYREERRALLRLGGEALELELEDFVDHNLPLEPYAGTIVHYQVSGDAVTAILSVGLRQEGHVPYTVYYAADLSGQLFYDGEGFSLHSPALAEEYPG